MSHTKNNKTGANKVNAVENETVNTNTTTTKATTDVKPKVEKDTKENQKVTIGFEITQMGKHPFSLIHQTEAKLKDITLIGIARKTGFALADSLHNYATKAMESKTKYGSYITAFRPKSVFKIKVYVNGMVCFNALETKGMDAIRLMNGKGDILSRSLIVDKFELIANAVQSANSFINAVQFVTEIEDKAKEGANV